MPIFYWWKVHATQDYSWILNHARKINRYENQILSVQWERLFSEFIDQYGFGENFQAIINKRREIANLKIRKMESGDESLQTFVELCELELAELMERNSGKHDFYESKAQVESIIKYRLDPMSITVSEYHALILSLKNSKPSR